MKRVVVVGAGVAGLTGAHYLAQRGAEVTLLEAEGEKSPVAASRRASRCASLTACVSSIFPLEHGVHGVWRSYRNLQRVLGELGLTAQLSPALQQELVAVQCGKVVHPEVGQVLRETRLPSWFSSLTPWRGASDFFWTCLEGGPHGPLAYCCATCCRVLSPSTQSTT